MKKEFVCPTCGKTIPHDLPTIIAHTEQDIVEAIKKNHPDWIEQDGVCKKCCQYYKQQLPRKTER